MKHLIIITLLSLLIGCSKEVIEIDKQLKDTTMALPSTNITTSLVSNTIGLASNKVGELCAKSKTGGTSGFAFNITENGGQTWDGTLISGAEPYWNKYSNDSPGEWCLPANETSPVYFRLKRDATIPARYSFQLGGFRAYNHDAVAPSMNSGTVTVVTDQPSYQYIYYPRLRLGDFDWRKLSSKFCVIIYKDGVILTTSEAQDIPINNNAEISIEPCTITTYGSTTVSIKVALCDNFGDPIALLPNINSTLLITIKNPPASCAITVYVDGVPGRFNYGTPIKKGSFGAYYWQIPGTATVSGLWGKQLIKMIYKVFDFDDNLVSSSEVTSGWAAFEGPDVLEVNQVGQSQTFYAWCQRYTDASNYYVRVQYYYQ